MAKNDPISSTGKNPNTLQNHNASNFTFVQRGKKNDHVDVLVFMTDGPL